MILSSWLAAVFGRLNASSARHNTLRKRRRDLSSVPCQAEILESRRVLANTAPTVANVTVDVPPTTMALEIYPYGQNNFATGTVFANIPVVDIFDPVANDAVYTPGNMVITGGNQDRSGNGLGREPFAIRVVNGVDCLVVNDGQDLYKPSGVTTFTINILATDNAGLTATGTVTINLTDPNFVTNYRPIVPEFFGSSGFQSPLIGIGWGGIPDGVVNVLEVNENATTGTIVGNVTALDQDNDVLTYSLPGVIPGFDAAHPAFDIDPFTGKIRVIDPSFLNYEARMNGSGLGNLGQQPSFGTDGAFHYFYPDVVFAIQVRVTDFHPANNSRLRSEQNFPTRSFPGQTNDSYVYIRLRDVGETPPDVSRSTQSLTVKENSPARLSIGFFELVDGLPNFVSTSPRRARKGIDPSEPQQTHSFAIVGGNPNNAFAIDYTTGEITVNNAVIDYELQNVYDLQIAVTDRNVEAVAIQIGGDPAPDNVAPLTTVATLHIDVIDVNEPTSVPGGQSFALPENTLNNVIVGTAVANDPDTQQPNGQGDLVYSIISGNTVKVNGIDYNGLFSIDPKTGTLSVNNVTGLPNSVAFNYENQPAYSLTIKVVDRNNETASANNTVIINLVNVNETAPSFNDATFTIAENRPLNDLVGQVTAAVGELGNTITAYEILAGNTGDAFNIDATGKITVRTPAAIDFETNRKYILTVRATDNGNPALFTTATVTINVTNLNEQIVIEDQSFGTVNENLPNGTVIGQIVTTDPDNSLAQIQGTTFSINGGNINGAFTIDNQGRIIVANSSALNFETNPVFTIITTVTDTGATAIPATSMSAAMTIRLRNVNDPPNVGDQVFSVPEHSLAGTVVGLVIATDQDLPQQTLTYSIISGDPTGAFVINPTNGVLMVTNPDLVDYATTQQFNLVIQVTDNGSPSQSSTAAVTINVIDADTPHLADQTISLTENTPDNTLVTTLAATNGVGPYAYMILSGNDSNAFALDFNGNLTVADSSVLDYETVQSFVLQVLVVDSQAKPLGDVATITINLINLDDVNFAPELSDIETESLNYAENQPPNYATNLSIPVSETIQARDANGLLASATIQITSNYVPGQDYLVFTNTPTIQGSWNVTTGTLTLTGLDTADKYTTALKSILFFERSDLPSTLTRTISYTVTDDGGPQGSPILTSNVLTRDINVISVNDPPVLNNGNSNSPLSYTEDAAPVPILPNLNILDADSNNLIGAVIQITSNYNAGTSKDLLSFVNTGNITGSWNATTGTLTLTGLDSVSNYRAALRSVSFSNQQDPLTTPPRTVTLTITDDTGVGSNVISRNINITTRANAAVLSGIESTPKTYKSNDPLTPSTPITSTLVIADFDSATQTRAIVKISGNYVQGQDLLVIDGSVLSANQLSASWNAVAGELTLTGAAPASNYQNALRAVRYVNSSSTPSMLLRTVSFQTFDDTSGTPLGSNIVNRTVSISTINLAPSLSINSGELDYTEKDPATSIASELTIADSDSPNMNGATIMFTSNYQFPQDRLVFVNTAKIQGTWNSTTGVLTLTGVDSKSNYEAALQSVKYFNTSNNPSTLTRSVSFQISDGLTSSNIATQNITVERTNDAPLIAVNAGTLTYNPVTGAVPIAPGFTVTDPDSSSITTATIEFTSGYQSGLDILSFVNTPKITGSFNAVTGILTLTGSDTLGNYRSAIQSVKYAFSGTPTGQTKTVRFSVSDGTTLSQYATRNIIVTVDPPIVLAPVVATNATGPLIYGNTAVQIAPALTVTDPDSNNLVSAKVKISSNYQNGIDQLLFTNTAKITGSFDAASGTLTLTGMDSVSNYRTALRSVMYKLNGVATSLTKTISFTANDGSVDSKVATINISLGSLASVVKTNAAGPLAYSSGPVVIADALTVTDPDSNDLVTATIKVNNFQAGIDQLSFVDTAKIKGSFNATTGILTLTGTDSLSNYRSALRTVKYNLIGVATGTKTISFSVNDGFGASNVATRDITLA